MKMLQTALRLHLQTNQMAVTFDCFVKALAYCFSFKNLTTMQENATIDKSWDFLVNADEIDIRKMKSASQFFMFFRFNSQQDNVIKGKNLLENILKYSYHKTDEPIPYNQFLQDIAYAYGVNKSNAQTIEETELALLQKFKDEIINEATDDEKETIASYKLFSSHDDEEEDIKVAINKNIERISKLLDIDVFSEETDDLFFNDHPLVDRCYRAVVYKHYSLFRLNKLVCFCLFPML